MNETSMATRGFPALHIVWSLAVALLLLTAAGESPAADPEKSPPHTHPLGIQLQVLERDLTSPEYLDVLATMIPTDLEAEWKRVGTPDNYLTFAEKHGGVEAVQNEPGLKAAYDRRKEIADGFLALMRKAYDDRKLKPPFDDAALREILAASERSRRAAEGAEVPIRVVMPAPGAERQWPRFRGPTGQGVTFETGMPLHWSETENVVWRTELPGRGNSSPVIWDDHLFVTAETDEGKQRLLLCYSVESGDLRWQRAAPEPTEQEKLYWKNTYASSTPVTDGERVIAFFGNSGLVCFDFEGKQLWHQDLGVFSTTHGPGTSPILYRDKVILIQDQNRGESVFAAFDKQTGTKLWQDSRENSMGWSTPVIVRVGERDELIYNGSNTIAAYDPDSGEPLWSLNGSTKENIPMIVVGGGLIFSTSGRNGPTLAIRPGGRGDVTGTHLQWSVVRGGPHVPSPAYYEGRLYIVNDTGIVTCLEASSGETLWQKRLRGRFSMSPVEVAGKLLLTNEDGYSWVLAAGPEFEILAENDLKEPVLATPAVLNGRIYFRTASSLICIGESVK